MTWKTLHQSEAAVRGILLKKDIDVGRKSLVLEALFNKNTGLQACNLLKRDSNKSVFL